MPHLMAMHWWMAPLVDQATSSHMLWPRMKHCHKIVNCGCMVFLSIYLSVYLSNSNSNSKSKYIYIYLSNAIPSPLLFCTHNVPSLYHVISKYPMKISMDMDKNPHLQMILAEETTMDVSPSVCQIKWFIDPHVKARFRPHCMCFGLHRRPRFGTRPRGGDLTDQWKVA